MSTSVRIQRIEDRVPSGMLVTQVYGFCSTEDNHLLVLWDGTGSTLPGGKPEPEETYAQTLQREVDEEASATLCDLVFLGYQLVKGDPQQGGGIPYAQVRMVAKIARLFPPRPDPASGILYERLLVPADEAERLLGWGMSGRQQIYVACRLAQHVSET